MASLTEQLQEVRGRTEVCLYSNGKATEVRTGVMTMAKLPLPPCAKYRHIIAENMVVENSSSTNRKETLAALQRLSTALNILEKYGCNLTNPNRPKYWRTVKHNNPVFRATVDAIQGGRAVLGLYGYTNQQPDGLSFPEDVLDPDVGKVAAVTLEVMSLRMELEMLIRDAHPHPEFYERIIPTLRHKDVGLNTDTEGCHSSAFTLCHPQRQTKSLVSPLRHPSTKKNSHSLSSNHQNQNTILVLFSSSDKYQENCMICGISRTSVHCLTCLQSLCSECDKVYHTYPELANHSRSAIVWSSSSSSSSSSKTSSKQSSSTWNCVHCSAVNSIKNLVCDACECSRTLLKNSAVDGSQSATTTDWQCKSCTVVNMASSVLCEVCERPRLAARPSLTPSHSPITPRPPAPVLGMPGDPDSQWVCQFCTYLNYSPAMVCEICDLARPEPASLPAKLRPPSPVRRVPPLPVRANETALEDVNSLRQRRMKEEGLKLILQIKESEKKGVSPEEVFTSMKVAGHKIQPSKWLRTELPLLLDQIRLLAATSSQQYTSVKVGETHTTSPAKTPDKRENTCRKAHFIQLSREEAMEAWLTAGGAIEKAARQALRDRLAKVEMLLSLGHQDPAACHDVLRQSGGEMHGALVLLQRPLLEVFHRNIWSEKPQTAVDIHHPDKQRTCRRLLAEYGLPSWGRCELALSLLLEHCAPYSLEDVVQAVKESHDREFIKRVLAKECPICLSVFPHSKMQSLTSCQCSMCCGCFQQHFTIAVRNKHIRDMVCPVCWEPDINDPEHLNSYFSTLDIQLRDCLEPEVYELFHKKLTEQALIKDPKFLWCCHCSYGFIYDGNQLKVTCFQCHNSFCAQCKKPWESQHSGLTCEQYQLWKRENDPEYQKQGLAGYLRDNGITCPNCRFQYALSKGGCMHFCCSQCRYQFCSGCNNPFHTTCAVDECSVSGLHAHHPRDCLFYLRDWEPSRLQALLQSNNVRFNTEPPPGTQTGLCGVIEQKDEGGQQPETACGAQTQPGHAGLCEKHYREYLVSLINCHSIDPAPQYSPNELQLACKRYKVDESCWEGEDGLTYCNRVLKKLMDEVPLGDKVPRRK